MGNHKKIWHEVTWLGVKPRLAIVSDLKVYRSRANGAQPPAAVSFKALLSHNCIEMFSHFFRRLSASSYGDQRLFEKQRFGNNCNLNNERRDTANTLQSV